MKKIVAIITAAAITAMAGAAMASDTNTLTVTASVTGACKFVSNSSTLAFGALDPAVGADVDKSVDIEFWCTKGVTETFDAADGSNWSGSKRQMKETAAAGTDLIPYDLTLTPDTNPNVGPGTYRTLTVEGKVLGSDYVDKNAGSYTDSVLLTITP